MEVPTDSRQDAGQGKEVEAPQGKDKSKDKGKGKCMASDTIISQPEQAIDPGAPKAQAQDLSFYSIFIILLFYMFIVFVSSFC